MPLQVKKGSFAANTGTGNQAVTGVGFQGKAGIFWTATATADGYSATSRLGIGIATSSSQRGALSLASDDAAGTTNTGRTRSNSLALTCPTTGGPSLDGQMDFVSWDSDGFTVSWPSDPPAGALVIHYLVFGGSSLTNALATSLTIGTGSGNLAKTGVGFQPDCVIFIAQPGSSGSNPDAVICIGAATSSSNRAAAFYGSEDGVAAGGTVASYQVSDKCLVMPDATTSTTLDFEADLVSMDSDGFTINRTNAAAVTTDIFCLCLKGGNYRVGVETQKTSTGTKATTGVGFQPAGLFLWGTNRAASASVDTTVGKFTVGGTDGTTEGCTWLQDVEVDPSNTNKRHSTAKAFTHSSSDSTTDAEADITSLDPDGFTADWTTADATAREFLWLAAGNAPAASTQIPRRHLIRSDAVHRASRW